MQHPLNSLHQRIGRSLPLPPRHGLPGELVENLPADLTDYLYRLKKTNAALTEMELFLRSYPRPVVFIHFGDHMPPIDSLPEPLKNQVTYVAMSSNEPLDLSEDVKRLTKIDVWFLPGLICKLAGCLDSFFQLNYLVAQRCRGISESCEDPLYKRYREVARKNFL